LARKRKALGRGLDALFDSSGDDSAAESSLSVDLIDPNPFQPRTAWSDEELASLAESIRRQGVLQPLVVRPWEGRFQLIAGERRLRAARKAGLREVPVVVRDASDRQMLALALIENVQRSDLGPIEKARGIRRLTEEFGLTQEEAGRELGMSRSAVANFQRLLELPVEVREMLEARKLSMGHGRALLGLSDDRAIVRLARLAVRRSMSVRQLEEKVSGGRKRSGSPGSSERRPPDVRKLEERLQRSVGARVRIRDRQGKGRIEISYSSLDELDRLLERLSK
jgi:ParB family chromosome partitioning protein